jgi:hypothetical protein
VKTQIFLGVSQYIQYAPSTRRCDVSQDPYTFYLLYFDLQVECLSPFKHQFPVSLFKDLDNPNVCGKPNVINHNKPSHFYPHFDGLPGLPALKISIEAAARRQGSNWQRPYTPPGESPPSPYLSGVSCFMLGHYIKASKKKTCQIIHLGKL